MIEPPTMAEATEALLGAIREVYGSRVSHIRLIEMKVTFDDGHQHHAEWAMTDDRRAAPKMGDSPAAPEDVAKMCKALRMDNPFFVTAAVRTTAANMLESLLTRNRALEGAMDEIVRRLDSAAAETDCFNVYEARDVAKRALGIE